MNINKYLLVFLIAISVLLLNSVLKVVAFTGPTEPPPSSEAGQALYQEYGKIGIGTRPTETLDVNGNVRASGSFIGAYSGSLSAANVTGPAAFGISYGTYNYAFPAALAVGTTNTSGLPTNGLYVAGNVGIGTTNPIEKLHVSGANPIILISDVGGLVAQSRWGYDTTVGLYIGNLRSAWGGVIGSAANDSFIRYDTGRLLFSSGPNIRMILDTSGNVGIGTTGPTNKLHVSGVGTGGGLIRLDMSSPANTIYIGGYTATGLYSDGSMIGIRGFNGGDVFLTKYNGTAADGLIVKSSGNVGIGTTNPSFKLNVLSNAQYSARFESYSNSSSIYSPAGIIIRNTDTSTPNNSAAILFIHGGFSSPIPAQIAAQFLTPSVSNSPGRLVFLTSDGSGTAAPRMVINENGNVGIGTTNPTAKLEVAGQIKITGGSPGAGKVLTSDANGLASWQTPASGLPSGSLGQTLRHDGTNWVANSLIYNNGANVGIGTTTPAEALHVIGNIRASGSFIGNYSGSLSAVNVTGPAAFGISYGTYNYAFPAALAVGTTTTSGLPTNGLYVSGNVGIGIGTPGSGYKLDVNGTGHFANGIVLDSANYRQHILLSRSGNGVYFTQSGSAFYIEQYGSTASMVISDRIYTDWLDNEQGITYARVGGIGNNWLGYQGGNVGIGTANPNYKLDVVGDINFTGTLRQNGTPFSGSQWTNTSTGIYYNSGNVGIGTTNPGAKLTVDGSGETVIKLQSNGTEFGEIGTYNNGLIVGTNTSVPLTLETNNAARMTILGNGNVGIGTMNPATTLHINNSGTGEVGRIQNSFGSYSFGLDSTGGYIQTSSSGNFSIWGGSNRAIFISGTTGNVGMGTTSPGVKLDVVGSIRANDGTAEIGLGSISGVRRMQGYTSGPEIRFLNAGNSYSNLGMGRLSIGGAYAAISAPTSGVIIEGNVGIGTTEPRSKLDVYGKGPNNTIREGDYLEIGNTNYGNWNYLGFNALLSTSDVPNSVNKFSPIYAPGQGMVMAQAGGGAGSIDFYGINWGGSAAEKTFPTDFTHVMRLQYNGNVGIGTTNPSYKLTVVGQIYADDGTSAADIIANKIDAGTVDPVYTIDGVRYATYFSGMTGIKEETTGVINLEKIGSDYKYVIDFDKVEKGSDLWLFAKITNIEQEGLDKVVVILSPNFDGRVWYEKNSKEKKIIIYGKPYQSEGVYEVSYRLTAPRFDYRNWSNYSSSHWEGINLDKYFKK